MKYFLCLILFGACSNSEQIHKDNIKARDNNLMSQGSYIKGSKTGLCFFVSGEASWLVLTNVPCTPEVEKLIRYE